jgi:inorganic triphosphatase YgiF
MELEATLLICPVNQEIIRKIQEQFHYFPEFRFAPLPQRRIQDVYFDHPKRSPVNESVALRVRETDGRTMVTLKGPSRVVDNAGVEREEYEEEWSERTFDKIEKLLMDKGVFLSGSSAFDKDVYNTFQTQGLIEIQRRLLFRQVYSVLDKHQPGVLAELCLDRVLYKFDSVEISHWELEIESTSLGGTGALRIIIGKLLKNFPGVLHKWDFGKLATGMAIEKLLMTGEKLPFVNFENSLPLEIYLKIHRMLTL